MPLQFQTTFTGKRSPSASAPAAPSRAFNAYAVLALLIAAAVVALAVVLFFYKVYLTRSIAAMDASLAGTRKSFEPEFIAAASRLNSRIEAVKGLLAEHTALSPLFDLLEKKTLETVRFSNFSFDARNKNKITIAMTGAAKSFNAVALQSDVFGAEKYFKDPIFANFTLNEQGEVIFNFTTSVDPHFLRYGALPANSAAASSTPTGEFDAPEVHR